MSAIKIDHFAGGRNLNAGHGKPEDHLAQALRDVADDLAAVQSPTITAIAATDLASVLTLANELRTNAIANEAVVIKTTKA